MTHARIDLLVAVTVADTGPAETGAYYRAVYRDDVGDPTHEESGALGDEGYVGLPTLAHASEAARLLGLEGEIPWRRDASGALRATVLR